MKPTPDRDTPSSHRLMRLGIPALVALLGACAGGPRPVDVGLPRDVIPYLLSPLVGYPESVDEDRSRLLSEAYHGLVERGEVSRAAAVAESMLREDPSFHPATVLSVQVDFLAGRYPTVLSRVHSWIEAAPGYTAALVLLARTAELEGDLVGAYAAYRALPPEVGRATPRSENLRERAVQTLRFRLEDALARNRVEEAEAQLELLSQWGPEELATLEATRNVAAARGDREAELDVIRALALRGIEERGLLERQAELELEVGEPRLGLRLFQDLNNRFPFDDQLTEKLAVANFRWRLRLLPDEVQELADGPELTRAEFAKLLFWLVPGVRYAQTQSPRIATDILDQPYREEIVRVVNLGLMRVDETLHRFDPERPIRRVEALNALLLVPARLGGEATCLGGAEPGLNRAWRENCRLAVSCGVVSDEASCQPAAPLLGVEAQEWIRRTLDLLEGG